MHLEVGRERQDCKDQEGMERHPVLADKELLLRVDKEHLGQEGKERLGLVDKEHPHQGLVDRGHKHPVLAGILVPVGRESALEGIHPDRCWSMVVVPAASC